MKSSFKVVLVLLLISVLSCSSVFDHSARYRGMLAKIHHVTFPKVEDRYLTGGIIDLLKSLPTGANVTKIIDCNWAYYELDKRIYLYSFCRIDYDQAFSSNTLIKDNNLK